MPADNGPPPDGFKPWDYECPECGAVLTEYAEQCPNCGQNLFEVYSGTYRPRRSLLARVVAAVALLLMVAGIIGVVIGSCAETAH